MPPRRSARAASAKPATEPTAPSKPKPKARSTSRSRTTKRAASPDTDHSSTSPPPAKRSRASTKEPESQPKTNGATSQPKPTKIALKRTKTPVPFVQSKPYFNPLPQAPEQHIRPAPQLFVWGAGNFGQFGMGDDELGELSKPKKNKWVEEGMEDGKFGSNGAGLESIAAGGLHTLFIDETGTIWSCGVNDDAALGRITKNVPNPEKPNEFLDVDTLTATPHPVQSLVDEGFRAVKVIAGDSISAAISSAGDLRVWGHFRANEGSLGFSSGHTHQYLPAPILEMPTKPGDVEKVVSVASGNNHLVVLTTHGNVYTWGAGEQGQLGRKVLERRKIHGTTPEKVVLGTRSRKAVVVGAGNYHSFAVDDHGEVWGWGLDTMGQTGTGAMNSKIDSSEVQLPKRVVGLSKEELGGEETVVEIVGGEHHTLFLTSAGRVFACGRSESGQLGLPDDHEAFKDRENEDYIAEPQHVVFPESDDPVRSIAVGTHSNMAVTEGGALFSWGEGSQSELGLGADMDCAKTPTVVVRKTGGSWSAVAVACGGQHALALLKKKS